MSTPEYHREYVQRLIKIKNEAQGGLRKDQMTEDERKEAKEIALREKRRIAKANLAAGREKAKATVAAKKEALLLAKGTAGATLLLV